MPSRALHCCRSCARVAAGVEHDRTCLFILMWFCAPRCTSILCSGCSSPCGRCFGSRSTPASTLQPPLQPLLPQVQGVYVQTSWRLCSNRADTPRRLVFILLLVVLLLSISCAPASSLFFSIECGRCSSSRSPAVLSYSLSFLMSSLTQDIDVHPSWRLCSIRAGTPRWFATVLLHFMLLLSIFCTSASSSVRSAFAAAAFSLLTCAFASFLMSCASFPFVAPAFLKCFNDFLVLFRARAFQYWRFLQFVKFFHV